MAEAALRAGSVFLELGLNLTVLYVFFFFGANAMAAFDHSFFFLSSIVLTSHMQILAIWGKLPSRVTAYHNPFWVRVNSCVVFSSFSLCC